MAHSITTRLIVLLTLCATVVIGLGLLVDYRLSRQQILQGLNARSLDTIEAATSSMENWLKSVQSYTAMLARILEQSDYSEAQLQQLLRKVVANNDDLYGSSIALNTPVGSAEPGFAPYYFRGNNTVNYVDLATGDYNYRSQAWFVDTLKAGTAGWREPYFDEGAGNALMTTYAVPVFRTAADGQRYIYAVVTADITLHELDSYLQRLELGEQGFTLLLTETGVILSARNADYVLQHYSAIYAAPQDIAAWDEMLRQSLTGQSITRPVACHTAQGRCVVRLDLLDTTGWPVGVVYSEDEILAPLKQLQLKSALLGIVTLLLMAAAATLVIRRITAPLQSLVPVTERIARGELDTPLPPVRRDDEVARLVSAVGSMQTDLKAYIGDIEAATATRSRLEGELSAAREIQMSLLPSGAQALEQLKDVSLWATVRPARSVGGDLYSYHVDNNTLTIAVGDVSDKGVPAALFMARVITLIQQRVTAGVDLPRAAAEINNALETGNDNCMFVTLFLGALNTDTGLLQFVSAGHCAPALLRNNTVQEVQQDSGPALGLAPDVGFTLNTLQLQHQDRLAIYTDGVDEAFNSQSEMFGLRRFYQHFQQSGSLPLDDAGHSLLQSIDDFAGEQPQFDDITLLLVQWPGDAQRTSQSFVKGQRLAGRALDWVAEALAAAPYAKDQHNELLMVTEELVSNIERHAGLGDKAEVQITLTISDKHWTLETRDPGKPFNPLQDSQRATLGERTQAAQIGGLGVHLVLKLTDHQVYHYRDGQNVLRVTRAVEPGTADSAPELE
tara:strand:- start:293204 stop:295564 length:2361 start_codon:yes stop_codon:yes gene_type:complete